MTFAIKFWTVLNGSLTVFKGSPEISRIDGMSMKPHDREFRFSQTRKVSSADLTAPYFKDYDMQGEESQEFSQNVLLHVGNFNLFLAMFYVPGQEKTQQNVYLSF